MLNWCCQLLNVAEWRNWQTHQTQNSESRTVSYLFSISFNLKVFHCDTACDSFIHGPLSSQRIRRLVDVVHPQRHATPSLFRHHRQRTSQATALSGLAPGRFFRCKHASCRWCDLVQAASQTLRLRNEFPERIDHAELHQIEAIVLPVEIVGAASLTILEIPTGVPNNHQTAG